MTYYTPSLRRKKLEGRNINRLSIAIPYPKAWLSLGTPNPPMIAIAEETSGLRRTGLSPVLRLLIPTFSLPNAPASFTADLHCIRNAPLPLGDFKKDPNRSPTANDSEKGGPDWIRTSDLRALQPRRSTS